MNVTVSNYSPELGDVVKLKCSARVTSDFNVTDLTWIGPQGVVESNDRFVISTSVNLYQLNSSLTLLHFESSDAGLWNCSLTVNISYPFATVLSNHTSVTIGSTGKRSIPTTSDEVQLT